MRGASRSGAMASPGSLRSTRSPQRDVACKDTMPMPRVLVSDKLSPAAVQIFKDRGVEVDYLPDLGKDKDKLLADHRPL